MASHTSTYPDQEQQQPETAGVKIPADYVPTPEEKEVFNECNHESFWYRSVPISFMTMAATHALVTTGSLSPSPRFGPLPKVAFAGIIGYFAGKISYISTCQEKFMKLENSTLGEVLRNRTAQYSQGPASELSPPDNPSFDPMFQTTTPSQNPSYSRNYDQGYNPDPMTQVIQDDNISDQARSYMEDEAQSKPILYENLRLKNRENYEVTLNHKADTTIKPFPVKDRPKKEVKKNIYGDTWEE